MFENIKVPYDLLPSDGRFGCGPSKVPTYFVDKLRDNSKNLLGHSHRNKNILSLVQRCQEKIKIYFKVPDEYHVLLGNGGASIMWETLAFSAIKNKSVHFTCGEFSNKWYSLTKACPWLNAENIKSDNGSLPELKYSEDADLIAITQNETSTGVMIPECPNFNSNALLAVDSTSIAGMTNWNWNKTDLYYFSLQKAFASEGGLFFAIASPRLLEKVKEVKETGRYIPMMLDLSEIINNSSKHQTLNTPSITSLFFLECALDNFISRGGIDAIEKESIEKSKLIYDFAENCEFTSPYVKEPRYRSLSTATIDIDEKISADKLVKFLRENGIYDINSYRKLNRNQIRIALFPFINKEDVLKLINTLNYIFEKVVSYV
jgi:phosphoserine aminotransferase